MAEIKASYRFIPVSRQQKYYSPEWKNYVSHDIPFRDSVSGEIKYTLTANTAIFIKGNDGEFCNVKGKYFIPATSMKGCIRSVLEVLSFGHLDESRVKNEKSRYAFRDIQDRKGYMKKMENVYCGWLTEDGKIVNWGEPIRIKYEDILSNIPGVTYAEFKGKSILEKYSLAKGYLTGSFTTPNALPNAKYDKRKFCKFQENGLLGTIFFSGAMQNKNSDFVLLQKDEQKITLSIEDKTLKSFKSIYPDYHKIPTSQSTGGRAVFFTKDNEKVTTIGLSYLHKYHVVNEIRDAIPENLKGGAPDLADVMFGSTKYNLKGRVQFSAAMQEQVETLLKEGESILNVLGSPQASYYPTYLQNQATWDTKGALISGIKRYPIKPRYDISKLELFDADMQNYIAHFGKPEGILYEAKIGSRKMIPRDNEGKINFDTISKMKPLKEGSTFTGYIRFHNLNKEELGGLLSALTFHGNENECKHSLGQAKAYGYGSVSIEINEFVVNNIEENTTTYLNAFSNLMDSQMPKILGDSKKWLETSQIKELLSMAKGFGSESLVDIFTPMMLEDFGKVKRNYMKGNDSFSSFIEATGILASEYVKKEEKKKDSTQYSDEATITVYGRFRLAILTNNTKFKQSITLEVPKSNKTRLKVGDKIEVIYKIENGKINKLIFKQKV